MRALSMSHAWESICQQTQAFLDGVGCTDVIIGLSGGLDSSVVAVVACQVLGPSHVHGVLMPGPYSSQGSVDDAHDLAHRLGMDADTVPITGSFRAFSQEYEDALNLPLAGLAAENTQARLRMCVLMALSNESGWLVLNTGNLSEAAMGYSTLYGDTAGAFAPLGGLYKTEVFKLARYLNASAVQQGKTPPIPENVITKPPSAELSEGQSDEASLGMSYADMDEVLSRMLDKGAPPQALTPFAKEVWKRYQANAFKRALEPPFAVMQGQE